MVRAIGALLLLLAAGSVAQQPNAKETLEHARKLYTEEGARVAMPEFLRALELYRAAKDVRGEAVVLGLIGNCYKQFGDYPKALEYLRKALFLKQQIGDTQEEAWTLNHLGLVFWSMSDYPHAIEHYNRSLAMARKAADRSLEAAVLNNLGMIHDETGDYKRSLPLYEEALKLHRANRNEMAESYTLGNLGGWHLLLGRYQEAKRYYQEAFAISERLHSKPSMTLDLGNIGVCLTRLGEVAEALRTFDRAIALAREVAHEKEEADWHKGKGSALLVAGKYDQALEEYRLASRVHEKAGHKRELVEALNDLGNLSMLLGDAASAEQNFLRATRLARAINHPRGVTTNLIALGDIEMRRKRYTQASARYQQAFRRAHQAGERSDEATSLARGASSYRQQKRWDDAAREADRALEAARLVGGPLETEALIETAEVARGRGKLEEALERYGAARKIAEPVADPDIGWRIGYGEGQALEGLGRSEDAVAAYRRAASIIESVRSELKEERYRSGYLEDKYQVYVALVRLLLKLRRPEEAFLMAERYRARSYSGMLSKAPPLQLGPRGAEIQSRIRQLEQGIERESAKPAEDQRAQAVALFSSELAAAEREFQDIVDDARSADPRYAAARAAAVPPLEEIRGSLPPRSALVEYILGGDNLLVFVLTRDGLDATTVPARESDVRARIELLRDLILREGSDEWRKPSEGLRRILIAPIEKAGWLKQVERLYIVPHGVLHYMPFAVLPGRSAGGTRCLVDDYVLAYLPAASALVRPAGDFDGARALLAAAPASTKLAFAEEETRSIGRFFGPGNLLLNGNRATESAFKRAAGRYQVLHLATHGRFNKVNPLLSALDLEPDRQNDGRLEVYEVLNLRLRSRLVTLSACDTALGGGYFADVPAGDDFVGLTRAFLDAGSRSVLASLWQVNDRSTLELMQGFYRRLTQSGKAAALAEAQRAMRRAGGRYSHPYFWAPFVLVGEM